MMTSIAVWLRVGVAAVTWALVIAAVQGGAQADIGKSTRELEQRIELQLELMERGGVGQPQPESTPQRPHEESIEPWELVGV